MTDLKKAAQQALGTLERCAFRLSDPAFVTSAIINLKAALEQPEQEPVAWGIDWGSHGDRSCCMIIKQHTDGTREVVAVEYAPSYTHQPRREWRKLTDEQLLYVYNELPNWGMDVDSLSPKLKQFARAIEAALKERNA
jgi:hypothetical protein